MNVVGIIAEYNPFHNGHAWNIREAKRLSGADFCVVVMSGDFMQRGEPAVMDKFARAEMALSCGADLVIELPVYWAVGSAEFFAMGGVSLLEKLGVVDSLCFGSECGDGKMLQDIATMLAEEPEGYRTLLRARLKDGMSFPAARETAVSSYLSKDVSALLREPNNILGIEYLKALRLLGSGITPITIPRIGSGYHDCNPGNGFSSATALRKLLLREDTSLSSLQSEMPAPAFELLKKELTGTHPVCSGDFSMLLHYRLLMSPSPDELSRFQDISSDLADRISKRIPDYTDMDSFVDLIKTKQITESRIRRCLLHLLLNIRTEDVALRRASGWNGYARVLGLKKESTRLLHEIKGNSRIPLITKLADAENLLSEQELFYLQQDILASHIYHSAATIHETLSPYNEYRRTPIIV